MRPLLCFSRAGKPLWQKEIAALGKESSYTGSYITKHGYASSTPVSDGKMIYVYFGATGVLAFDLDGTLVDTAPDLLGATNAVLAAEGRAEMDKTA